MIASEILIIFALVLLNGILAGAEIAVVAVRSTRLRELVDRGSRAALAVRALREQPERFLATVQIGITVVAATAGAFGGAAFAADLAPLLTRWEPLRPYAPELALVVVVSLVSYLSLVVGELVPKSLALRSAERYALLIARPLYFLSQLARPLVWFLTSSSNAILKLFGDRTSFVEARLSPAELVQMVDEAGKAGTLNPRAGEIASRALQLSELAVRDVMVPRTEVVSLHHEASREELRRLLLEHTHSRFPVTAGGLDHVVGYISVKDVLAVAWEEQLFVLQDLVRPTFFVPLTKSAVDVLVEMRARGMPFAVAVDEHGGMSGILTLEDLFEELVGDIVSEHARPGTELIRHDPDGSIVVLGTVAVRDLNRELGLGLPEERDWTSVGGLCVALAKRIPAAGDRLPTASGVVLEVADATPRRVRLVRIRRA